MKQYLWIVDLTCAITGALIIWGFLAISYDQHRSLVFAWTPIVVYLPMVLVPVVNWAQGGNSTAVAEMVLRYLAGARDVLRDRWVVAALLGFFVISGISGELASWAIENSRGPEAVDVQADHYKPEIPFAMLLPRIFANQTSAAVDFVIGPETCLFSLPDVYVFGTVYVLLLPVMIRFLMRSKGRPGQEAGYWVVFLLGVLVASVVYSTVRSVGSWADLLSPPGIPLWVTAEPVRLAAVAIPVLMAFNAILRRRTDRTVEWLLAFAGVYLFWLGLALLRFSTWLPLVGTTSPSDTRMAFVTSLSALVFVVSATVMFVPATIAMHGVGLPEALRRNFAIWRHPFRVAVFVATLALMVFPLRMVANVMSALIPESWPLVHTHYFTVLMPVNALTLALVISAYGVFVLESGPDQPAPETPASTP